MGRVESTDLRTWAGIALIAATGLIHLVETPEYLATMPYIGVLFALSVVGALVAAFGIYRGERWGWVLGVLVAGASLVGYLLGVSNRVANGTRWGGDNGGREKKRCDLSG